MTKMEVFFPHLFLKYKISYSMSIEKNQSEGKSRFYDAKYGHDINESNSF